MRSGVKGTSNRRKRTRGQSELIGIVLVFGLVIAGASAVVILGGSAISESQDALSVQRAEKAMTQFDSQASLVALGTTDVKTSEFPTQNNGDVRIRNGTGWMNITIKNTTDSSNNFHLVNQSLGSVEYRNSPEIVAYQGGGVWRSSGNGSVMVSPPEFHFRNGTLTLPIINVSGSPGLGDRLSMRQVETIQTFPDRGLADGENPLDQHKVLLVVRSDYYQGWGRYFEERTDGVVEYNHDKQKAMLSLRTPIGTRTVSNAIAATAGSGTLTMNGAGFATSRTDSYNSSVGPYSTSQDTDGNITISGDVDISGNSEVYGDIRSGGWVSCTGASSIDGRVHYTDTAGTNLACGPTGGSEQIGGINGDSPINSHVADTVTKLQTDNDNADPGVDIDTATNTLDISGGSATLTPGDYFLRDLSLNDQTLELETNGDVIRIAVRDYVDIERSSQIDIKGNGKVKLYVRGDTTDPDGYDFDMQNTGAAVPSVTTPGSVQNSTQFWVYGQDDMQVQIDGSGVGQRPKFQGIIYAPAGTGGSGSVYVTGKVFGAIATGEVTIENGGEVHFDKALQTEQVMPKNTRVVKITYLHVSVDRIRVSGG